MKPVTPTFAKIGVNGLIAALSFLLLVPAISLRSARAEDQIADAAAKARALPAKEITSIYEDRTWPWDNGAAYFAGSKHKFAAWAGKGAKTTYAEGSWSANDQGQLCFSATWHSIGGSGPSTSCFEFRGDDKNIYHRKLPDGTWYLFSHLPALPSDEIKKLEPGDHVAKSYDENKRYLAEHRDEVDTDAAKGRALTGKEIDAIYDDRTWPWSDGGAYFAGGSDHKFIAWVGKAAKATYAEGTWSTNDQGQLCYTATWHNVTGGGPSTTCYEHRRDDNYIYQRRLPDGKWFIFSNLPATSGDEIQKIKPGDQVSDGYEKTKRYVAEHASPNKKK